MHTLIRYPFTLACLAFATVAIAQAPKDAPKIDAPAIDAPKIAAPASAASTIKSFGKENKQTVGTITDLEKGDNGCYIEFTDDKNRKHLEVGTFEMCDQKGLKGKRVEHTYKVETIQAASCYGDKKCTKTETIPIITSMKALD